jgi:hypothetical protein
MNPSASSRTKDKTRIIRHLYLDLDRDGAVCLAAIRNSAPVPSPNHVLDIDEAGAALNARETTQAHNDP